MPLRITFVKSGSNTLGAVTGTVTLWDGGTVVRKQTAFSGGKSFNPIDDGVYRLHLDIRGGEESNQASTDGTLKPFYGIQKVGKKVPDASGNVWDMQWEWGVMRARLNPTNGAPDHGEYLHGKTRPDDWTHGCVCDRSGAILDYLWSLSSPPTAINFEVTGGLGFNMEELVHRNMARAAASDHQCECLESEEGTSAAIPCDNPPNWPEAPAPTKYPLATMNWATGTPKDKFGCTRNGGKKFHAGIDVKAVVGTKCFATEDGKVEEVGYGEEVGSYVSISFKKDGKTYGVAYCHLKKAAVKKGDLVKAGDTLGETGVTGNAEPSNPHLHLEVQDQVWVAYADAADRSKHALNPNSYV
jgi:hypothetical protein